MITEQPRIPDIPAIICTDSFSLYECLVRLGTTKEKLLMIDIMAIRESYERRELTEIRWINDQDNPADALTKENSTKGVHQLTASNELHIRVEGKALATAGCLRLIDGTAEEPGEEPGSSNSVAYKRWERDYNEHREKRKNAIKIISTSIDDSLFDEEVESALSEENPKELWTVLLKHNQKNNRVWISARRSEFNDEKFDSENETIQKFYNHLVAIKATLSGTPRPLQSEDVLQKLLSSIPQSNPSWQQARFHCLNSNLNLADTMSVLNNISIPAPAESGNFARSTENFCGVRHDNSRGKRGGRGGFGGFGDRGGGFHSMHGNFNNRGSRGNYGRFRDRRNNNNINFNRSYRGNFGEKASKGRSLFCKFCQADGHQRASCSKYHRFAREARDETKANSAANNGFANMAQEYNGSAYFSDFQDNNCFDQKKLVTTADGNVAESTVYWECKIGSLTLKNVWLVPSFSVRLISVRQLGDYGIDVLFKGSKFIATKDNSVIIYGNLIDGLYQVPSQQICSTESAQAVGVTPNPESSTDQSINATTSAIQTQLRPSPIEFNLDFESQAQLWHYRLGHAGYKAIERLAHQGIIKLDKRPSKIGDKACVPCLAGKMKESFNKKAHNRTHQLARRIHVDISGILPESFRGYRYFLLVVDDTSRCSWLRPMKNKETSTVLPLLKEIIMEIQRSTGQ
ncbi:hypothetical protein K3495_g9114 [Podosphaera aphanis]|nr:hypothetical protein K3495_g9114 [Podosphaera aphanis]